MAKFIKFLIVVAALLVVIVIGASLALRAYLTDARVRAMIIPPVEKALGRTVEIGHVKVSLFSGIQVYDFVIKEENGQDNFISSGQFVLTYDLLPLLQKKVVVRNIRLVDPAIRIVRDWRGVFNFSSLALLAKKEQQAAGPDKQGDGAVPALPVTVEIKNFSLENGTVKIQDALKEIPATDITANADIGLEMGHSLADLRYQGDLRFVVDTDYKGLAIHEEGRVEFDHDKLNFTVDMRLDEHALQLAGSVADYLDTSKLPALVVNVSSQQLDIEEVLASLAILSEEGGQKTTGKKGTPATGSKGGLLVPADLSASGEVRIAKATYQQVEMTDFQLNYTLDKAVFTVSDLKGKTMGGEMRGEAVARLQRVPSYEGKLGMHSLQLAALQDAFIDKTPARATGAMNAAMTFNGSGISPEQIKKRISALGEFSMQNGRISGAEFSRTLAMLLDLPELTDLDLSDMAGNFAIKKGVAQVRSRTSNDSFKAVMDGSVGLDGSLNMPVELSLSPQLSSSLQRRVKAARYMEKDGDRILVHLTLAGMADAPKVKLDTSQVRRQATESLIDEALGEDASPEEKAAGEAVKGLLNNLFGK